eukprot:840939-Rhodomonas_salina.1
MLLFSDKIAPRSGIARNHCLSRCTHLHVGGRAQKRHLHPPFHAVHVIVPERFGQFDPTQPAEHLATFWDRRHFAELHQAAGRCEDGVGVPLA